MKFRIELVLSFWLVFPAWVFAQDISIKYGPERAIIEKTPTGLFAKATTLTEDREYLYNRKFIDKDERAVTIEKVRKDNGEILWEKKLPVVLPTRNGWEYFVGLIKTSVGFITLVKKQNSSRVESYIIAQKLDEDFKPISEEKTLVTSKKTRYNGSYYFKVQRRRDRFLLSCGYLSYGNHKEPYTFSVFDTDLNKLWQKEIALSEDGDNELDANTTIDNDGNLIALFLKSTNGKDLSHSDAMREYIVYRYNYRNDQMQSKAINSTEKVRYHSKLKVHLDSSNKNLSIFGIYAKTSSVDWGQEGILSIEFDVERMELLQSKILPFSKSVIEKCIGTENANDGYFPRFLRVINKIKHENGGTSFVMEITHSNYSGPAPTDPLIYYYEGVLIISFNENDEENWSSYFNFYQGAYSNRIYYCSAYVLNQENTLVLLFNALEESIDNREKYPRGFSLSAKGHNKLFVLSFDEDGKSKREIFTPESEKNMYINLEGIKNLGEGRYLLSCESVNLRGKVIAAMNAIMEVK